jgi:MFS family permease
LILPQSVLLGATFPCMSAGVMRRTMGRPGRVLALLYFANSIGAAGGVLVAGFFLIAYVGLPGTILTAACLNIVVALVTYMLVRHIPSPAHAPLAVAPHDDSMGKPGQEPLPMTSLWKPPPLCELRHRSSVLYLRNLLDPHALSRPWQRDTCL